MQRFETSHPPAEVAVLEEYPGLVSAAILGLGLPISHSLA